MNSRLVYTIGGGPGGLFAARLLKRAHPDWDVRLYERMPADETFGFGVGLTAGTLRSVRAADPEVYEDLLAAAFGFSTAEFRLPTGTAEISGFHSGVAIGRAQLLRTLLTRAQEVGVVVEVADAPPVDELAAEADLVVAADGVSSAVRDRYAADFGPSIHVGRGFFLWCGSTSPMSGTVFGPALTEYGAFVVHAYPYAAGRSTYVFEASRETLQRAGFLDRVWRSEGASDEEALAFLSQAFSELLGGGQLVGNRSRWTQFRTVSCRSWQRANVVLLGDAVATAHPSIGSGTKLAMESAIALADVITTAGGDPAAALPQFEQARRPAVDRLQKLAHRSHLWWESFESRQHLSPSRMATAYLSRAGAVSLSALRTSAPELAAQAAADFAGLDRADVPSDDLVSWVLQQPLHTAHTDYPQRVVAGPTTGTVPLRIDFDDPWGPQGDAAVDQARTEQSRGATAVRLTGEACPDALRDRLAFGERIRSVLAMVVEIETPPELLDEVADGLLAGRADLAVVTSPQAPADVDANRGTTELLSRR